MKRPIFLFFLLFFVSLNLLSEISLTNEILLKRVLGIIEETYIKEVNSKELLKAALKGVASATGEETCYLEKEQYDELLKYENNEYILPFYYTKSEGFARIISIISPMKEVQRGDIFRSINGKSLFDLSYIETKLLVGKEKEKEVDASFLKKDTLKEFREKIRLIKPVPPEIVKIDEKRCVLKISSLEANFDESIKERIKNFEFCVIDLRNCASDRIDRAILWSGFLVGEGVFYVSKKGGREEIGYKGENILKDKKCFVLVNKGTARGGEVLTLALKKKFKIVGEETFGFSAMHKFIELSNGDRLRILTGYFLDENGIELKYQPIKPDITLEKVDEITSVESFKKLIEIIDIKGEKIENTK